MSTLTTHVCKCVLMHMYWPMHKQIDLYALSLACVHSKLLAFELARQKRQPSRFPVWIRRLRTFHMNFKRLWTGNQLGFVSFPANSDVCTQSNPTYLCTQSNTTYLCTQSNTTYVCTQSNTTYVCTQSNTTYLPREVIRIHIHTYIHTYIHTHIHEYITALDRED